MDMKPVKVTSGTSPVILAMPHSGLAVPPDIKTCLNERGLALADTDWHVDCLYDGLLPEATVVKATFHRYVIDANRDPSGKSLYPGKNTTGLCPLIDFDGRKIYRGGCEPDEAEIARRLSAFHAPYHDAIRLEIDRVRKLHGVAVLYDCHSIRAEIDYLFDGVLPDFNIGTNEGVTCAPALESRINEICQEAKGYRAVLNGRFKGGWTTRHYGDPAKNIHSIQMELAQRTYMAESSPWTYDKQRADRVRVHLKHVLTALDEDVRTIS